MAITIVIAIAMQPHGPTADIAKAVRIVGKVARIARAYQT